jgi:uncharacterized protein (TIGR04255 family)
MVDRHYSRAPITEALIDLQVEFTSTPPVSEFQGSAHALMDRFPTSAPIHFLEMNVNGASDGNAPSLQSGVSEVGVRLTSAVSDRILQLQRRGFTYSHMAPYTHWGSFRDEAAELWTEFVDRFQPSKVTRVAVRYINRIVIPAAKADAKEYFRLFPNVPDGMPQTITGCFMQLVMPQTDIAESASAVVNFAIEPNPGPEKLSFLLDFDVFSTCELTPESGKVWETLDQLRTRKNELFEASITDATRELFK